MFLPALLLRDLGWAGYAMFAIPNVLGAAAMGWVLARPGASEEFVARHRLACCAFSLVTIAFHTYFLGWVTVAALGGSLTGLWPLVLLIAAGLTVLVMGTGVRRRAIAAGVLVLSLGLVLATISLSPTNPASYPTAPQLTAALALAPVSILGFALCPYLDLTFHQARQGVNARGAKLAFGVGFGGFFLAMIVLTALYAPLAMQIVGVDEQGHATWVAGPAAGLLLVHLWVQSLFTIGVHASAIRHVGKQSGTESLPTTGLLLGAVLIGLVLGTGGAISEWRYAGLLAGELGYRSFMVFYGLLFPSYVLITLRENRNRAAVARGAWLLVGVAVLLALPWYWLGFLDRAWGWLPLGAGLVLGAGLLRTLR